MLFQNLFRRNPSTKTVVIVGLGNPEPKYATTRHNAGSLAADYLRESLGLGEFQDDKKTLTAVTTGKVNGTKVFLVKPLTFMNESGKSMQSFLNFYKLPPTSLIVIHDEVDLPSGTMKTTPSSRSAGHNGVQNIIDALGTQDFFRIRLGVGKPVTGSPSCIPLHDYVLQDFSGEERAKLEELFPALESVIRERLK